MTSAPLQKKAPKALISLDAELKSAPRLHVWLVPAIQVVKGPESLALAGT